MDVFDEEAYRLANDFFGSTAAKDMLHEEMGELLTAINQYGRKRVPLEAVLEEAADVEICLSHFVFNINNGKYEEIRKKKWGKFINKLPGGNS